MADRTSSQRSLSRRRNPRGQGGRLRDELIEAATRLMATGSREDQITLRAVTREAGVAPQSFYLHFASIDELLWDVYAREFATLAERLTSAARSARDPHRRLSAVCRAYCRFALEHPQSYKLMFSLTGQPDHGWDGKLPGYPTFEVIHDAVAACRPEQNEATTAKTTSLLWAALHGLVALRNDRPAFPWAPLETLLEELLAALFPQPSKHSTSKRRRTADER